MRSIFTAWMVVLMTSCVLIGVWDARAGSQTYGFTGSIDYIDNFNGTALNGTLAVGTPYTVTYTFDVDVPSLSTSYGYYDYNVDASSAGRTFNMTLEVGDYTFTSSPGTYGNRGNIIITDNWNDPYWYDTYQVVGEGFSASNGLSFNEIGGYATGYPDTHACIAPAFLPRNPADYDVRGFFATTADYSYENTTGLALWGTLDNFFTEFQTGNSYTHQSGPAFDVQCTSDIDYDNVITDGDYVIDTYSTVSSSYLYQKGIMEFDLGYIPEGATINSATLTLDIADIIAGFVEYPVIELSGYAGDGVQTGGDANEPKNVIGQKQICNTGLVDITIDPAYIESLLGDTDYLGLNLLPENRDYLASFFTSEAFPDFGYSPLLTIDFTPADLTNIPGDANGDGVVNVGDLGILAGNYGMLEGATWAMGDFNGDGKVNVGDLGILAGNYGFGAAESASVPEPMTLTLLTFGGLFLRRRA
jgi:hypothetical protein